MTRILDRYVLKELLAPFVMGVAVFTFFLVIDRIYHLTDLVITKGVPFHLVLSLLVFMLPSFLALTFPMALLRSEEHTSELQSRLHLLFPLLLLKFI